MNDTNRKRCVRGIMKKLGECASKSITIGMSDEISDAIARAWAMVRTYAKLVRYDVE